MKVRLLLASVFAAASLAAQTPIDDTLPAITVYSPRIANQAPVATFAMPVSALRFEPRVDLQTRNFAETQADVTIRGGIFENSGFKLGASTLYDPQTGHYFAEIPVAPAMLGAPQILTGVDNAVGTTNATVGTVAYGWRPIRDTGTATLGVGQYSLLEGEVYQGYVSDTRLFGRRLGVDVAWAHSDSDGSIPFGDHVLNRVDARIQLANAHSQTDLFAGYQAKFYGWPNMYTPFDSDESENLKTLLVALNHRANFGGGDYFQLGAYYRRNRDDYEYNRFATNHPYNHVTWVRDAALDGRNDLGFFTLAYRGEFLADQIHSTTLGDHSRSLAKLALVPEKRWSFGDGSHLVAKAGATYDDSNFAGGTASPVFELAREQPASAASRIYASYAVTTQEPTYTAIDSSPTAGLFRGNPNLGRETSRNLEAGVQGVLAGWSGQAAAFYRRDTDLVDWTFQQGVIARSANAVDVNTTGVELVAHRSWSLIELVVGYTYLTKNPDYHSTTVDASFYALNYARQRLTAAVTMRLTENLTLRLDNVARLQAANSLRTAGGDSAIVSSLGLTYRPASYRRILLSVQVDNLWNSSFQEIPSVPAARRQTSGRITYTW